MPVNLGEDCFFPWMMEKHILDNHGQRIWVIIVRMSFFLKDLDCRSQETEESVYTQLDNLLLATTGRFLI